MTTRLSLMATCVLSAAILALVTPPARATDFTWDGDYNNLWDRNSGNPNYRTNWGPQGMNNPIPNGNDNVFFGGATPYPAIELNGSRNVLSATFSGGVGYALLPTNPGDVLSLFDGNITASGTAVHLIASQVALWADGVWAINTPAFVVDGNVFGAFALTKTGAGTLTLSGDNSYSGGTTITGGVLQIGGGSTTGLIAGDVTNNASLIFNRSNNLTFAGAIGGTGSLTKLSSGALTLSGANTFSGMTNIGAGSIILNNAGALQNSTVSINLDGGLDVTTNSINATIGALAGSGDLNIGSQELVTGGNGTSTTYSGALTGTSDSILRHNGAGTLTLTGGPSSIGTLRAESGAVVIDGDIDLTSTDVSHTTGALSANAGDITIQGNAGVVMAAGSVGSVLDGSLTLNGDLASLTGGDRLFVAHTTGTTGSVLVEDHASLELTGGLIIGFTGDADLTVQSGGTASVGNVFLAIKTDSTGDALVTGTDSLLSTNNLNFSGQSASVLGGVGTLLVEDGGAVQVAQQTKFWTKGRMTINGGSLETNTLTNHTGVVATVILTDPTGGVALTVGTANGSSTFDGQISGSGSLAKVGTGTFTLTGMNTYSGGTIIDGGTLALAHSSAAGTGAITVLGSTIDYADGINVATPIDLQNDVTLNVSTGIAAQSGAIGETGGSFGVAKTGSGALTLSRANTFSGMTNINAGSIIVNRANALQNSTVSINVDDGLDVTTNSIDATIGGLAGAGDLNIGSQRLNMGGNSDDTIYSGALTGSSDASVFKYGTGALTLTGTGGGFESLKVTEGAVVIDGGDYTTGGFTQTIWADGTLVVRNSGVFQHGSRTDVYGSLLVETSGTFESQVLRTRGSNADVTVQSGGTLSTTNNQNLASDVGSSLTYLVTGTGSSSSATDMIFGGLSSGPGGTAAMTVTDGGDVSVTDNTWFRTATSSLTIDGGTFSTGALIHDSGVLPTISITDPSGGVALTVGTNNVGSAFGGLIQDAAGGAGSLRKVGSGTFSLTEANTYTGETIIDGGSIFVLHADALQNSTVSINIDGGLNVTANSIDATIGALAGTGNLALGSRTLETGGNGADTTYGGTLSGTNNSILRHNGAGTLTLTGDISIVGALQAHSGAVVVDGGGIDLTNTSTNGLLASGGDITIRGGADVQMDTTSGFGVVQNNVLTITGSGSSLAGDRLDAAESNSTTGSIIVEDSASLGLGGSLIIGFYGDGDLTVRSGATASANRVYFGISTGASGDALVTGTDSLLSSNNLYFGGQGASSLGAVGTLTVEDGGAVQVAGTTKFWTSASSMTVNGGAFETDKLTNHTGVAATINLTDPTGGVALTVGTNNSSFTFDGLIEGTGSLAKVGTGTFTPTAANTFSGTTHIDGGSIILDQAYALQNSTVSINVDDGLDVLTNSIDARIGGLAGTGALDLGSRTLRTGSNGADTIYSGLLDGTDDSIFCHVGAGTLTLTGGSEATPSSVGAIWAESGAVIIDGARIDLVSTEYSTNRLALYAGDFTIRGGADVRMSTTSEGEVKGGSLTVTGIGSSLTASYLGVRALSGDAGSILVEDNASVEIKDHFDIGYAGNSVLTVQTGAAVSTDDAYLGGRSGGSGDALVTGSGSVLSSNNLHLGGESTFYFGGTGTLTVEDRGAVQVAGETKFWTSASSMTIDGGAFETNKLTNHTGVVPTIAISDGSGFALTVGTNDGSSTFDGLITDAGGGSGTIMKVGSGTLTLTNASNSYSGYTYLTEGTLVVPNGDALGTGDLAFAGGTFAPSAPIASARGLYVVSGGGTIDVDSFYSTSGDLYGNGTLTKTGAGVASFGGDQSSFTGHLAASEGVVILGDASTWGVNFPGTLSVASGATVMLQDSSFAILSGTTSLDGGLLSAANGINLWTNGELNGFGTVASTIIGHTGSQISATGPLSLGDIGSTDGFDMAGTLDVGSNQVIILDADRAQLGSLTVLGGGTLSAANGFTITNGETLSATGDSLVQGVFTNNGVVDVSAGQTLVFNDDVDGAGNYTGDGAVQFNQLFSPGNSPAEVAFGGGLMLPSTSVLEIELGGLLQGDDYDFLDVIGDVTLNGLLDVSLLAPFVLGEYQQFNILSVGGTLAGTFNGLAEGGFVGNFGGTDLFITYAAGDGNDVALSSVPEPAALTLLALGGLTLLGLTGRRQKR